MTNRYFLTLISKSFENGTEKGKCSTSIKVKVKVKELPVSAGLCLLWKQGEGLVS